MLITKDLDHTDYRTAWRLQRDLFDKLVDESKAGVESGEEYLLFAEHDPVYTLGLHGHAENMLASEAQLASQGIECVRIERGGDITYHGPGQLVVYPIIRLKQHGLGVKSYIDLLEEAVIRTIAEYGVKGERVEGATGVWIEAGTPRERKICAIGVKCSRFVTMHGLALNVTTDLSRFSAINPCGFTDKGVTSLAAELAGPEVTPEEIGFSGEGAVTLADVKTRFDRIFRQMLAASPKFS